MLIICGFPCGAVELVLVEGGGWVKVWRISGQWALSLKWATYRHPPPQARKHHRREFRRNLRGGGKTDLKFCHLGMTQTISAMDTCMAGPFNLSSRMEGVSMRPYPFPRS